MSAAAGRTLLEVGGGEGSREGADVEKEFISAPHHLVDSEPEEEDLDADPSEAGQRPRADGAGDLLLVMQQVAAGDLELAVAAEVDLKAPIVVQGVTLHALGEDSRRKAVFLQHLVDRWHIGSK